MESVARRIMVIVLKERIIGFDVVKVVTMFGISLMRGLNTRVMVKLKQVVQMTLQKIISSVLSALGVSKILLLIW